MVSSGGLQLAEIVTRGDDVGRRCRHVSEANYSVALGFDVWLCGTFSSVVACPLVGSRDINP